MYHIKDDKRQKDTADRLVAALTKCLADKTMSEISVSDLSRESGVSRSTFYRSFDTPVDVLAYASDTRLSMLADDYSGVDLTNVSEFVRFSLEYWSHHSDILEALVNCDRLDVVQRALETSSSEFVTEIVSEIKEDFTDDELDYLRTAAVSTVTGILTVWIRHGKKETPEELFKLYRHARQLI